jgi:hypothetical protein
MRPNNAVTRAEAAKILYSTHQYEVPQLSFSVFSDVTLQDWFVQYANYLYATQIF